MASTPNQQAMSLMALLFVRGGFSAEINLHEGEVCALGVLKQANAVIAGSANTSDALCGFCGLYRGPIFRSKEGMMVQCPDCGPYGLDPASQRNWKIDDDWLIRKLRAAMDIAPHASVTLIADGVWEIGRYKKRPVVLARRIDLVERHGLRIFHGPEPRRQSWVITPRPLGKMPVDPLAGTATWWRLEDRFALHGMSLRLLDEGQDVAVDPMDGVIGAAVHGPFSEDFIWVHLDDWPHGPIRLSEAQAHLFSALWAHRQQAQSAEFLMREAGLDSARPIDVFKIKAANRGDPSYEGPLHVYETLVMRQRRHGLYRLGLSVDQAL